MTANLEESAFNIDEIVKELRRFVVDNVGVLVLDNPVPNPHFTDNEVELIIFTKAQFQQHVVNIEYIIARDALLEARVKALQERLAMTTHLRGIGP